MLCSHGGIGWMAGLDNRRGLFQPMILWFYEIFSPHLATKTKTLTPIYAELVSWYLQLQHI